MATVPPSKTDRPASSWLRSRRASFGYALAGVRLLVATQPHARFHLLATVAVIAAGAALGITRSEWLAVVLAAGLVWGAEAVNTAIEWLVDLVHPEWARPAGRVKDVAAGAVLLASIAAAAVGALVFAPRVLALAAHYLG